MSRHPAILPRPPVPSRRYGRVPEIGDIARRATRIVGENWDAVRKLAVALMKQGEIDQATVRALLDPLRGGQRKVEDFCGAAVPVGPVLPFSAKSQAAANSNIACRLTAKLNSR